MNKEIILTDSYVPFLFAKRTLEMTVEISLFVMVIRIVVFWFSGRHLASGSEGPGFESWLSQVDVESLGKAPYMNFPHPIHV